MILYPPESTELLQQSNFGMASTPLAVSEQSRRDMERICEIPPESIKAAIAALASHKRPIISPNTLRDVLAPTVDADVAGTLVRQLLSLGLLNTRRGRDIDAGRFHRKLMKD